MSDAQNNNCELSELKKQIPNLNETRIKNLEGRFTGPSSNGLMPSHCDNLMDLDTIKSKNSKMEITVTKSENQTKLLNENFTDKKKDSIRTNLCFDTHSNLDGDYDFRSSRSVNEDSNKDHSQTITQNLSRSHLKIESFLTNGNNSNKSNKSFSRKKTTPRKAEKKVRIVGNSQMEYLSTKRERPDSTSVEREHFFYNNRDTTNLNNNNETEDQIFSTRNISANSSLFNKSSEKLSTEKKKEKEVISKNQYSANNNNSYNNNIILKTPKSVNADNFTNRNTNSNYSNNSYYNSNSNINRDIQNMNQSPNSCQYTSQKIKQYFTAVTNGNQNSINGETSTLSSQLKILKDKVEKISDENEKLRKEGIEKTKLILEKDKEIQQFKSKLEEVEENTKQYLARIKKQDLQIEANKKYFFSHLKELEEMKRKAKKRFLNEQGFRLGRYGIQRTSSKLLEVWEEGEDFIKLKAKLRDIVNQKSELEKTKKKIYSIKRKEAKEINRNDDINDAIPEELESELNDRKELISFKITLLNKEEIETKESLEKLEQEKILYQLEYKRLIDEERSRYGAANSKERWPILDQRYLLLNLLGKGGYSEVYRAYDIGNHIEVACKIHQLNALWSDSIKESYIKHAIRENQIHKEINHPKVVKHYDTIEIDPNSFCTVLETCSGPDLYTYLKLHTSLNEKEAKIIISQILSGLVYLNQQSKRIIHYDLKPQNILFHNGEIKISDFGLAKVMEDNTDNIELTSQGVGTYWYLPPECFEMGKTQSGINSKVDVWSIGVIFFELLFGSRPFGHGMTQDKILQDQVILNSKKVEFPPKPIISNECKEFINNCLTYKSIDRYSVIEAYNSNYMRNTKK